MADKSENTESMKNAVDTLNQIASTPSTPKTIRNTISNLVNDLKSEEYSLSVRAANAISMLDAIWRGSTFRGTWRERVFQKC